MPPGLAQIPKAFAQKSTIHVTRPIQQTIPTSSVRTRIPVQLAERSISLIIRTCSLKVWDMTINPWIISGGLLAVAGIGLGLAWKPLTRYLRRRDAERAFQTFRRQREMLEAKFLTLASSLGKPRGLRWLDCHWQDNSLTFARDRETGLITAFVGVNIRFEAIEGGDMEDVAAVGTVREACALFHYQQGKWGTGGRALFNLDPNMAIERFGDQYLALSATETTSK